MANTCADLDVVRGQTKEMRGQVVQADDGVTPVSMLPNGAVVWATSTGLTKSTAAGTITWLDQARGFFEWSITSAEALAFPYGKGTHLSHEAWATLPDGRSYRLWSGKIVVLDALITPP